MRSLYLRIYLTVVAALALFALGSGWLVQRHLAEQREEQRERIEAATRQRVEAWGDLIERAMPPPSAPADEQVAALREWSQRLRLPMALDDAAGRRLGASDSFLRRELGLPANAQRIQPVRFEDGRTLWVKSTVTLLREQLTRAAVFEDALAGVQAGRNGRFGLVVGVDRVGCAEALRHNGADIVVTDLAELLESG